MDHVPLPRNPVQDIDDIVPFVSKVPYDGGPFLSYPLRISPPKPHLLHDGLFDMQSLERANPMPTSELESLFQTWLYFGLLHEIFGDSFKLSDFVKTTKSGKQIVTARCLPILHEQLHQRLIKSSQEIFRSLETRLIAAYLRTYHALGILHCRSGVHSSFSRPIKLSIALLASYVSNLLSMISEMMDWNNISGLPAIGDLIHDDQARRRMIQNGWCPNQINTLIPDGYSGETFWFLSKMRKAVDLEKHHACNEKVCKAFDVDPESYVPLHKLESCTCADISVNLNKVNEIIQDGSYPLLRIRRYEDSQHVAIDVIKADVTTRHIAISHVWADGLGNAKRNALPQCQLDSLFHLYSQVANLNESINQYHEDHTFRYLSLGSLDGINIPFSRQAHLSDFSGEDCPSTADTFTWDGWNDLYTTDRGASNKEYFVWIDTLCCPICPQTSKNLALHKMRKVYADAAAVLVLDATLQTIDSYSMNPLELCFRITSSTWARRLWTAQEAHLAETLWIQFADGPRWLKEILTKLAPYSLNLTSSQNFIHEILGQVCYKELRKAMPRIEGPKKSLDFGQLRRAIFGRSVSIPADEPLCLATMLGLDLAQVMDCHPNLESRMTKVWQLGSASHGIPHSILFHKTERLTQRGFRWAPRSLLNLDTNSSLLGGPQATSLTEWGLRVCLPGFKLSKGSDAFASGFKLIKGSKVAWAYESLEDPVSFYSSMRAVRTGINGAWLTLAADAENMDVNTNYLNAQHQAATQGIKASVLLQDYSLIEQLRANHGQIYGGVLEQALLGFEYWNGEKQIFNSCTPLTFLAWEQSDSAAFEAAYEIFQLLSREKPVIALRKVPIHERHLDNEKFRKAMGQITKRIIELSEEKIKEAEFIALTEGKNSSVMEKVVKIFVGDYMSITDIVEEREWIVD